MTTRDADHVARFVAYLRAERGASVHTVRAYERTLTRLLEHLKNREVALVDVRPVDLRSFLFEVGRDRATSTVARHVAAVRSFYRWLARTGQTPVSLAESLSRPRVSQRLPHVVSVNEADSLLSLIHI